MQNQQFEVEAREHGYKPDEYREILRRAQRIRAEKEERLSSDALAESAAEVGIREEDLRAAEAQIRQERAVEAHRRRTRAIAAAVAAAILALVLLFSYGSLNTQYSAVEKARANVETALQRREALANPLAEEGTENRIAVAMSRYNEAAANYNRTARSFPTVLVRPLLGFPGQIPPYEATKNQD